MLSRVQLLYIIVYTYVHPHMSTITTSVAVTDACTHMYILGAYVSELDLSADSSRVYVCTYNYDYVYRATYIYAT
jgi:hypothetical protein